MKGITLGAFAALTLAVLTTACANNDASSMTAPSFASGSGGGTGGGGGTTTPAFYTGNWWQTPPTRGVLVNGTDTTFTDVSIQLQITQSGTKIDGTARRFLTYTKPDGTVTLLNFDLGSPGRITGTVTATGLSIGIRNLGEARSNVGYILTLSADSTTLVNNSTTPFAPASFVRF